MTREALPKSQWGPGPWQDEPDALDWRDEATGYTCAIRRNLALSGALCGYVGVPPGHALHGWRCEDDVPLRPEFEKDGKYGTIEFFLYALSGAHEHGTIPLGLALKAHGGVNWSGPIPDESDNSGRWWFGFDCGHAGDFAPAIHALLKRIHIDKGTTRIFEEREKLLGLGAPMSGGERVAYRTVGYVKAECATLAMQLAALEKFVLAPSLDLARQAGHGDGC
jgi:hypothetical protein